MKIAIIDDERAIREEIKYFLKSEEVSCEISEFENGTLFLESLLNTQFELVFIDMHLGDIEGLRVAKILRQKTPNVHIVFATAYEKYAIEAFEVGAIDYLLKPFEPKRFREMLQRVSNKTVNKVLSKNDDFLSIQYNKKLIILKKSDILFIETQLRKSVIVTQKGSYTCTWTLSELETKLDSHQFFRVHKSFLVRVDCIKEIHCETGQNYFLVVNGSEKYQIPISRHRIKLLKEQFNY